MHEECLEVETEFSYVRRLAQARIDDRQGRARPPRGRRLGRRSHRRAAEDPRRRSARDPSPGRAGSRAPWRRRRTSSGSAGLEHLIGDATLVNLPTLADEDLERTVGKLGELERETSTRRRELHAVIDAVEAELAARHVAHS